jgi:anaerobic selenocysteine-containing dehydrogenase
VTRNGKANFITPEKLFPEFSTDNTTSDVLHLMTLRSNDQFNTTVYGYSDRFRGVDGTRLVVFMNPVDIERLGLREGEPADLVTAIDDGKTRQVSGLRIVTYGIPQGTCASYYPEANPLFPLEHHDPKAKTPGYKLLPVHVRRGEALARD